MQRELFGHLSDGQAVEKITVSGDGGLSVSMLTYGATLQSLRFRGKDLVLGYESLEDYVIGGSYQGATVGRYANRLAKGSFPLNGTTYTVACNEAGHGHLHGGWVGFNQKVWAAEAVDSGVRFSLVSPDGEEGYPGTLRVSVTMTVTAENTLRLSYRAVSDKDTILNLTNHSYFNLAGFDGGDVLDTLLTVHAQAITPVDEALIPTGEYLPVAGTPFDFRTPRAIGDVIHDPHPQIVIGGGIDHNFVLGDDRAMRHAVHAQSPRSGIAVDCYTDMPGVQLYTANQLGETKGKGGIFLHQHQGFCMETQCFPDSPHHPAFPTTVLKAEDCFISVTEYRFS